MNNVEMSNLEEDVEIHQINLNPRKLKTKSKHPHCLQTQVKPGRFVFLAKAKKSSKVWIVCQKIKDTSKGWHDISDGVTLTVTLAGLIQENGCNSLRDLLELYNYDNAAIQKITNGSTKIVGFQLT